MPVQAAFQDGITKFSSKPPGHDAARQRENQRRHRARVKGRICELEAALATTQSRLDDALKQIDELTAEVCRLRAITSSSLETSGTSTPVDTGHHAVADLSVIEESIDAISSNATPTSTTATPQSTASIKDSNSDCPLLPPPHPGESTITCRDAYAIIRDRNTPDLDSDTMNQWLKPGFRRAVVPGSGCRVETHVLLARYRPFDLQDGARVTSPIPPHTTFIKMTHFNPLGHISIGVRDYSVSRAFYTAALAPLGLQLVYDSGPVSDPSTGKVRTLGYGPDEEHELINIFEYQDVAPPGPGFHLAFNAPTRQAVIDFHAKAIELGGTDNGAPGVREHYGKNYFAAFVVDPDGWRLEAVCKVSLEQEGASET
ncbi:Glyoxalase/Bleomycin resistance protein/Dihydroxybiphenyl dioxygenase [Apiosordaria backusii]|uniref:Glyoxalase/Bleomycin resistance protein/Dihydroxybiphenyl dioxygenase n=1 Tax=Apiosordaria backusii TaxID=314023 RepID=A0AA40BRK1_9PEZI|nr:Glyoxalase/Bleomycin resistance protein/Dihydroxybiphenyl dioxygenase [Apiosordaria backusii]